MHARGAAVILHRLHTLPRCAPHEIATVGAQIVGGLLEGHDLLPSTLAELEPNSLDFAAGLLALVPVPVPVAAGASSAARSALAASRASCAASTRACAASRASSAALVAAACSSVSGSTVPQSVAWRSSAVG